MKSIERWVALADIHAPEHDRKTWKAVQSYLKQNKMDGVFSYGGRVY